MQSLWKQDVHGCLMLEERNTYAVALPRYIHQLISQHLLMTFEFCKKYVNPECFRYILQKKLESHRYYLFSN